MVEASSVSIYEPVKVYGPAITRAALRVDRNKFLTVAVAGKYVLHVGCTDSPITASRIREGNLLHAHLQSSAEQVIGIDIATESLELMKQAGFHNVQYMDAEDMRYAGEFDTVVAGDVLEHLSNPGRFVEGAARALKPDGELIIAVPCAFTGNNLKVWFVGREQVHRDHVCYFSPKTLSALCARFGLLPVYLGYTTQPSSRFDSIISQIARRILLTVFPTMAPAIIMRFKKARDVDMSNYFLLK